MALGATSTFTAKITGDATGAVAAFKQTERAASSMATSTQTAQKKSSTSLGLIAGAAGGVAVAAAGMAVDFAKSSIQAAQDADRASAVVQRVFGDARGAIDDFANGAAESVGMANYEFQQLSSQFGALITNLGYTRREAAATSVEMIQVAADLAAAFGTDTSQAIQAIGAVFRGERDPIEQFGISIKEADVQAEALIMTGKKTASQLTAQEKALATQVVLLRQAEKFTGAYAEQQDTLNGKMREANARYKEAQARLGAQLSVALGQAAAAALPFIENLVKINEEGAKLVEWMDDMSGGTAGNFRFGVGLGMLITNVEKFGTVWDHTIGWAAADFKDRFIDVIETNTNPFIGQQRSAEGFYSALQRVNTEADRYGQVAEAAVEPTRSWDEGLIGLQESLEAAADEMERLFDAVPTTFDAEKAWLDLKIAADDYYADLVSGEMSAEEARSGLIGLAQQAQVTAVEWARLNGAQDGSAESARLQIEMLENLQETFPGLRDDLQDYIDKLREIPLTINTQITWTAPKGFASGNTSVATGAVGASGGIVTRPTWSLIGEAGPEAVVPLNQMPGASPLPAGGAPSIVVNVYGSATTADAEKVVEMLTAWQRSNGPLPLTVAS